ncbi:DUF2946 family protein [Phenylobacterium sp. VNQ135]|uniref:DUF2946 family protein n=1 Tax=Phenylobacterium sp. VNQ135 TaxID=3400922 RepID=UPI003C0F5901
MGPSPNQAVDARTERRAMIALVAVFALLVQLLAAMPAMAARPGAPFGDKQAICTSHGLQIAGAGDASDDGPRDGPGGDASGSCGHCACPPADAALAPPMLLGAAKRFAYAADVAQGLAIQGPPPARGPPRPFGQGPPAPNA